MTEQAVKESTSSILSAESQRSDPCEIMQDFCETFTLEDCRQYFWELLDKWVISHEIEKIDSTSISNIFFFYRHSIKMMEAAYSLSHKRPETVTENPDCCESVISASTQSATKIETNIVPNSLEKLLQIIITTLAPDSIFLINLLDESLTVENTSIELLILLPPKSTKSNDHYHQVIASTTQQFPFVKYVFYRVHEIVPLLQKGHIFYTRVCNKRHLIYANNSSGIQFPDDLNISDGKEIPNGKNNPDIVTIQDQITITSIQEKARRSFEQEISKYRNFLEGARYYKLNKEQGLAAFMLQQATEHTLRSVILCLMDRNIKTHNLTRLLQTCRLCAKGLLAIFPLNNDKEKALLKLLNAAYVNARYTNEYAISDEELDILLERVEQLQSKAKEICLEKIKAFGIDCSN
jgi:HEPN domain-containing protein